MLCTVQYSQQFVATIGSLYKRRNCYEKLDHCLKHYYLSLKVRLGCQNSRAFFILSAITKQKLGSIQVYTKNIALTLPFALRLLRKIAQLFLYTNKLHILFIYTATTNTQRCKAGGLEVASFSTRLTLQTFMNNRRYQNNSRLYSILKGRKG